MLTDIWTMVWKEWKELVFRRVRAGGDAWGLLLVVGVFALFPLMGENQHWLQSPIALLFAGWIPLGLTGSIIADSFAGERERHTLETLLATRLSDHAILFGKIAAAVSYGYGLTMIMLVLQVIALNVAYGNGRLLMYAPSIALGCLVLALLGSLLPAGLGVFFSLRAPSVRSVQQWLGSVSFGVLLIPLAGARVLPAAGINLLQLDINLTVLTIIVLLAILDAVLLVVAMRRFERTHLILD